MKEHDSGLIAVTLAILAVLILSGCTTNVYRHEVVVNGKTNLITFTRQSFLTRQNIGMIKIKTAEVEASIDGLEQDQIAGVAAITEAAVRGAVKGAKP